ncbi:MAG: transcriptional repressor [Deltaproteobacteria bacterium]|nr:transcriptional repressor [Deltaproteobacteria bacterium]
MQSPLELIQTSGLMVTPQRVAILEALLEEHCHPSPELIYKRVSALFPRMSLATVYNALDRFEEVGLVRKVNALFGVARYDAMIDSHLHAVCTECGRIDDVPAKSVPFSEFLEIPVDDIHVQSVSLHLLGLCDACKEREKLKSMR